MRGLRGTVLLWDTDRPGPRWPIREVRGTSSSSEEDADDDIEVECDVARRECRPWRCAWRAEIKQLNKYA
jgi:hypothetical protein